MAYAKTSFRIGRSAILTRAARSWIGGVNMLYPMIYYRTNHVPKYIEQWHAFSSVISLEQSSVSQHQVASDNLMQSRLPFASCRCSGRTYKL